MREWVCLGAGFQWNFSAQFCERIPRTARIKVFTVQREASASSTLNLRVQPLQFCSGVVDLELPVHAALFGVGLLGPDPDLRLQQR